MAPRKRVGLSKSMAKSDAAANQFSRNADKPRTPLYGRSKVVADSDASEDEPIENEDDNDIISRTKGSNNKKPANGFAVVISTRNTQRRQTSNTKKGVTSPSSISSNTTNTGDQSSTYDTPGTSAVATPAEAIVLSSKTNQGSRKISMSMRAAQLRNSDLSLSSGNQKRKRHAGEDHDSDSALGKSYTGFEDDSALPSESALGDSIIDMARPKKRKVKTGRQERQQSIDEQVALALEREENELLDAQIATAISESINQEMDVDSSSDSESESESDDVPLLSRSRRGKTGASMKGSKGRKDIKNGRLGSIARKPMKLPSRPARSKQPHLNQEISDSEGESDSSGLSTGFEDSDDWDSPLSELGLKATSKSMSKRSNITKGKAQGRKKWETDEEPLASMASETDSEEGAPSGPQLPNRKGFRPSRGANRTHREREKLIWQHPEILTMWGDLDKEPKIIPEQAKQPEGINRELKSFQLEGLNWMVKQEKTIWKGGLLGDEMGMGKTIQAVSLIMSDFPAKNPTLVVVPPVALMQWQSEISDYTNGALKVLVYHGTNSKIKGLKKKDLMKYNVIMISYSGLESMYRKEQKGWSRKDEDGDAIIVKEDSLMHSIQWHRIILDEAHNIKSRSAGVAKACFAMNADYKWCLSGTPLQNRIGEFFSLLRFLEVKPFACYMCKACSCKELHWTLDFKTKRCDKCSHGGFHHVSIFNHELLDPIQAHGHRGPGKEAFDKLKLLTDRLMLRRMKRDHTTAMELPPKDVTINNQFFGEEEHDFASSIMSNTNRQFETYVARGVMLNNYANIFGLIMQMRQVADHPDLILKKHAEGGQNILICVICDEPAEDAIRSTCRHDFCRRCVKGYVRSFDDSEAVPDCPRCHISLSIDLEQPEKEQDESAVKKSSIINRIKMENWTSSSKIELLVYELYKLRATGRTHKSIVFSQFTSMLQLVEWRLHRAGFNTVMLDGTMSPAQRQSSIKYFMDTVDVEVFLVSLKAGGVALNLTEASRVFIVDPWWNPAAEWQSADRCHRIGQHRPCSITRLCIEDSVESRMVLLQEKKANMINSTINADESAMQNLTPQDMQFLFRGS